METYKNIPPGAMLKYYFMRSEYGYGVPAMMIPSNGFKRIIGQAVADKLLKSQIRSKQLLFTIILLSLNLAMAAL